MKRFSISSILLLAVSAVIAHVLPSKESVKDVFFNGHVTATDAAGPDQGYTCAGSAGADACFTHTVDPDADTTGVLYPDSDTLTHGANTAAAATNITRGN